MLFWLVPSLPLTPVLTPARLSGHETTPARGCGRESMTPPNPFDRRRCHEALFYPADARTQEGHSRQGPRAQGQVRRPVARPRPYAGAARSTASFTTSGRSTARRRTTGPAQPWRSTTAPSNTCGPGGPHRRKTMSGRRSSVSATSSVGSSWRHWKPARSRNGRLTSTSRPPIGSSQPSAGLAWSKT